MKKLFLVAAFAMVSAFASAQFAVGVHTLYGTEVSNLGIGVRARYDINEQFRLDGNFNYYFKKNGLEFWDINANLHYLFNITDRFSAYPLGGLGLVTANSTIEVRDPFTGNVLSKTSESSTKLGFNFGGGVDFALTDDLYLNGEVKYQIVSGYNQAVMSAGIVYKF
ncbi:MAG: outer membrane protein [Prevotella conceptionensis]